jgi:KaiC/GvpD/RAD55 family RecA-like ATPase
VPPGFDGTNIKWAAGECKTLGYAVAPGSYIDPAHEENAGHPGGEYRLLNAREPAPAPQWLLDLCARPSGQQRGNAANLATEADERDFIPDGERDNELAAYGGFFRRRGDSEARIADSLWALVGSGLVEQPPGREVTRGDCERIARSVVRYDVGQGDITLIPGGWTSAADIEIIGEPIRWWVRDFVPRGELVMLYGKGGIGKSSWASWLAADVTRRGGKFAFIGVEEPFKRFAGRAIMCGAERGLLFGADESSGIVLPTHVEQLEAHIAQAKYDVVYFDSVYSHFALVQGLDAATRARKTLGPLAEMAQRTGCTVIGVFHERKDGDTFLGSVEMVNVARFVLRATRNTGEALKLSVEKTNGREPTYRMTFEADSKVLVDPLTDNIQREEDETGKLVPFVVRVPRRGPDEPTNSIDVSSMKIEDDTS